MGRGGAVGSTHAQHPMLQVTGLRAPSIAVRDSRAEQGQGEGVGGRTQGEGRQGRQQWWWQRTCPGAECWREQADRPQGRVLQVRRAPLPEQVPAEHRAARGQRGQ